MGSGEGNIIMHLIASGCDPFGLKMLPIWNIYPIKHYYAAPGHGLNELKRCRLENTCILYEALKWPKLGGNRTGV